MSKAIKCDRCKKCFDPFENDDPYIHIEDLTFAKRGNAEYETCDYILRYPKFDLCPECSEQFETWVTVNDRELSRKDYEKIIDKVTLMDPSEPSETVRKERKKLFMNLFDDYLDNSKSV